MSKFTIKNRTGHVLHQGSQINIKAALEYAVKAGADLYGADLRGADLREAKVAWGSHQALSEILLRAAGEDTQKRMIAGLIRISTDWCWDKFLGVEIDLTLREWALGELAKWVTEGDDAPEVIRQQVIATELEASA